MSCAAQVCGRNPETMQPKPAEHGDMAEHSEWQHHRGDQNEYAQASPRVQP
jgi:hypothetical protein